MSKRLTAEKARDLAAAPQPPACQTCQTCNDIGMIGGPSYYAPDEGGVPCPDCSAPQPAAQGDALGRWLVVNIGCIECGVSTALVGRFDSKELAEAVANECAREHGWRDGGQNEFEVFDLDAPCSSEYAEAIDAARTTKKGEINDQ